MMKQIKKIDGINIVKELYLMKKFMIEFQKKEDLINSRTKQTIN